MKHSIANPFPWFKKMTAESPVVYDTDYEHFFGSKGTWHVFRYDDVQRVLGDYENFSAEYLPKVEESPLTKALTTNDPPYHTKLRSLVSKAFTPKAIEDMKPWIEEITNELLDKVAEQGEMDIVRDLATPVPIQVIAKMLGVPYEDREKFKYWSIILIKQPSEVEGGIEGYFLAQQEMGQYFTEMITKRQKNPTNDLISHLVQAEVDGEKLSIKELIAFCILLLVAGNETTTNLINNSLLTLTENPEVQEHLSQHPKDIGKAIEEALRFRSPVQYMTRIAAKDTQLGGQLIKKGDLLNAWIGSANRDESKFENADQFDLHRTNLRHTSFGHGIHYCLGSPLARLEANIVLRILLERFKQFQLKFDRPITMNPTALMYSIKELPVVFQKR
ncbi:cytochrome P450 [Shimazuella kribbensis]|uniref:cytochrome P450 n=1 Tax=Shimazuella kribbensis TaxID=139808 RepID=UPI0003FA4A40|nr:cytochrome P450 [Shimazuella kribbensis]